MRELRYCATVLATFRFAAGQVARAQSTALARGWLEPAADPGYIALTAAGRRELAAAGPAA